MLYPLKFKPLLMPRIWGGTRLSTLYGKQAPPAMGPCGESWELSGVEGSVSVVSNGPLAGNTLQELLEVYMDDLVGGRVYSRYGNEFPLLIKLIDATDALSVQVHPSDQLAAQRHNAFGKTEMWYILQADPDSTIITGFTRDLSQREYLDLLQAGRLEEVLKHEPARPNDYFFIPAGKVHAIGKGIVLAEIQQTSDVTYRIYDWNRLDSQGRGRELHTELALDAIDLRKADDSRRSARETHNQPQTLVECPYFTTRRLCIGAPMEIDCHPRDSFTVYICTDGAVTIGFGGSKPVELSKGQTSLVSASLSRIELIPNPIASLLEVFIP